MVEDGFVYRNSAAYRRLLGALSPRSKPEPPVTPPESDESIRRRLGTPKAVDPKDPSLWRWGR